MVLDSMHIHNFHYQMVAGAKMLLFFGVNNSSSVHLNNKEKNILVLGEAPTQELDDTTATADAKYSINFTQSGKKLC